LKKFLFVLAPALTEEQPLAAILSSSFKASARQASKQWIVPFYQEQHKSIKPRVLSL